MTFNILSIVYAADWHRARPSRLFIVSRSLPWARCAEFFSFFFSLLTSRIFLVVSQTLPLPLFPMAEISFRKWRHNMFFYDGVMEHIYLGFFWDIKNYTSSLSSLIQYKINKVRRDAFTQRSSREWNPRYKCLGNGFSRPRRRELWAPLRECGSQEQVSQFRNCLCCGPSIPELSPQV